ncbi:MAG: T9SS type A sorting domain-containing protein [Prolixibacteraceae bacterium]|nr:T9SS type A sorting domain-containing protein [Prolixibacteraceae bacterium]
MKRLVTIIFIVLIFLSNTVYAQILLSEKIGKENLPVTICYASNDIERIAIPPPEEFLLKSNTTKKSEIIVTYSQFPPEAQKAFDYAISIWESIIESDIPIQVEANWRPPNPKEPNTLGFAAPIDYVTGFKNIPHKDKYYPITLAEKISGEHINPYSSPDITCTFHNHIDWYFGLDQETPGLMYDFVTVVLHEIGHGLGFTGFFDVRSNQGLYEYEYLSVDGLVSTFDFMVVNAANQQLVDKTIFRVPSTELYNALTSGTLYSNSKSAAFENNGSNAKLFVDNPWNGGSSVYHLDDATYPASSGNSLMTHAISRGESVHNPGPITMGIMDDIGWNNVVIELHKPKDIEQIQPIVFNANLRSSNELDSTSLFVMYASNSPENTIDSVPLTYNAATGLFSATIFPANNNIEYFYYIKVKDIKSRVFRLPTETNDYFTVNVGSDFEKPVILHTPIEYFLTIENEIGISAQISDNLGIDKAYVEFSVNTTTYDPFSLELDSEDLYKGVFPVNVKSLNDGDIISYNITATDLSQAANSTTSPSRRRFSFKIEKISNPVIQYSNNFDISTTDFTLYDFIINKEAEFENGALNSPHPYPSPNLNNKEFNFTTLLKSPIILKSNTTISYDEVVLVEPGEDLTDFEDETFWDYVIVEASKDHGKTWLPIIDGYDSKDNRSWEESYNLEFDDQRSLAVGSSDLYVNRRFNITENGNFEAGDTVLIQFRLFSDPYANGWGWCIDNLDIHTIVSAPLTELSPGNVLVYPNPFNEMVSLSVNTKNPVDRIEVELYNLYGQTIFSDFYENVDGEISEKIDMIGKPSGIYLLNVKENGIKIFTKKLVKH